MSTAQKVLGLFILIGVFVGIHNNGLGLLILGVTFVAWGLLSIVTRSFIIKWGLPSSPLHTYIGVKAVLFGVSLVLIGGAMTTLVWADTYPLLGKS